VPSSTTHAMAGGATAVAVWIADRQKAESKIRIEDLISIALLGCLGGLLADLIEPAISPNHRGFAHSIVVVVGLIVMIAVFCRCNSAESGGRSVALKSFAAAYLSHLFLDACTPKGIPLR